MKKILMTMIACLLVGCAVIKVPYSFKEAEESVFANQAFYEQFRDERRDDLEFIEFTALYNNLKMDYQIYILYDSRFSENERRTRVWRLARDARNLDKVRREMEEGWR